MLAVQQIEALILAGGKGTRLRSIVSDRPKPLAPVAGRPFLEWLMLFLKSLGITRFVLCTGYMSEAIEDHFGDGAKIGADIRYSREEKPLGTGGAIRNAMGFVTGERFLVLNGDSYCKFDLNVLLSLHTRKGAIATTWLAKVEDRSQSGTVEVGPDSEVREFREKSREAGGGFVNAGIYVLERQVIEREIPEGISVSIETTVFPNLIGRGLYACLGDHPLLDIGTPASYLGAEGFLRSERAL